MPIHNQVASTVALAKSWLLTLDRASIETKIPTATLELMLQSIVDMGTPAHDQAVSDAASRTVMGRMAQPERGR